jgi:hypothetical protein
LPKKLTFTARNGWGKLIEFRSLKRTQPNSNSAERHGIGPVYVGFAVKLASDRAGDSA